MPISKGFLLGLVVGLAVAVVFEISSLVVSDAGTAQAGLGLLTRASATQGLHGASRTRGELPCAPAWPVPAPFQRGLPRCEPRVFDPADDGQPARPFVLGEYSKAPTFDPKRVGTRAQRLVARLLPRPCRAPAARHAAPARLGRG